MVVVVVVVVVVVLVVVDALRQWMGSGWTLSWLAHGCSEGTDGVCELFMVGTWPEAMDEVLQARQAKP